MVSVVVSLPSLVSAWIQPRVDVCGSRPERWRSSPGERCLEIAGAASRIAAFR